MTKKKTTYHIILKRLLKEVKDNIEVQSGVKIPYSCEIKFFSNEPKVKFINYKTDILILQKIKETWKPRIIIETKINSVTIHDAITYSHKALTHKNVYPYLRYGILIGNYGKSAIPGRLIRHGQNFDFMLKWETIEGNNKEWDCLIEILKKEYQSSILLEKAIYDSRKKTKKNYIALHKDLIFKE